MDRLRAGAGRVATVGVALLALVAGILVAQPSAAEEFNSGSPTTISSGVIRLRLGAADFVRFDPADGAGGFTTGATTQDFQKQGKCSVDLAATPAILSVTAADPEQVGASPLGLSNKDALGIEQSGKGRPCGQVEVGQQIVLGLGADVTGLMDAADIAVEGKFNGAVAWDAQLDGVSVLSGTHMPGTGSDNGPDSDPVERMLVGPDVDTDGVPIVWDTIVLTVFDSSEVEETNEAFSLHGSGAAITAGGAFDAAIAADPAGTEDTVIRVVESYEGTLDCESNGSNVATDPGASGEESAELYRGDNALGTPEDCEPIPYDLDFDPASNIWTLRKALGNQENLDPRFYAVLTYPDRASQNPPPPLQIDYETSGVLDPHDMVWCLQNPMDEPDPVTGEPVFKPLDPALVLPAGELWCIVSQNITSTSDSNYSGTHAVFGAGDPRYPW